MGDAKLATNYTVREFIADVKATLAAKGATHDGLKEISQKMKELSKRPDLFELGQYRRPSPGGNTIGSFRLYAEPDNTLILSVSKFSHEHPTPVHTHNTWGVICGYTGQDHYIGYERVDDESEDGFAELREVFNRVVTRGDAVWWMEYPQDIHLQQAIGEPSWELLLMGRSTGGIERLHFDPENHRVWKVPARQARSEHAKTLPPSP